MKEMTEKEALQRAAAFCSEAEHCTWEVKQKLVKWSIDSRFWDSILLYLIREKFIDESRYATCFIREKLKYNKWGRVKIKYALFQKQIPESTIEDALEQVDEQEYIHLLQGVLEAKRKLLKSPDSYERNKKLIHFALSRGFEAPLIYHCLKMPSNDLD